MSRLLRIKSNTLVYQLPIYLLVLIPISGVSYLSYDFGIASLEELVYLSLIVYFLIAFKERRITQNKLLILMAFLAYFGVSYLLQATNSTSAYALLKSFKPYLWFILLFLIAFLNNNELVRDERINFVKIVFFALLIDILVWYYLLQYSGYMPDGIRKEFYLRNGVYRYNDFASLLLQFLIVFSIAKARFNREVFIFLFLGLVSFSLSQDRVFFLYLLVLCIIKIKGTVKLPLLAIFSGLTYFLVERFSGSDGEVASRFISLLDPYSVLSELNDRFITPAIAGGYSLDFQNFFFGEGYGFRFYIPWYEYRGLDPWHFSVDSFYVTYFIKHGLLGVLLALGVMYQLLKSYPIYFNCWVLLYLLTHNGPFVLSFLLALLFVSIYANQEK